ncbi:MAG: hypothetical protein U5L96_01565 [Owenweeksia sp.]|nr:hypothetical protein [Owenweeksia sp.]
MKDKHPIDDYFKEGLVGYKSKPSAGVWQKIEAQTQSRHRRGNLWYLGRAAVVLLLVGMGNWWQFNHGLEETAITNISGSWPSETIAGPGDKKKEKPEEEKKADEPEKKQQPNRKKAMPIMRSPVNARPIYVQNIHVPELDDEKRSIPWMRNPLPQ